MVFLLTVTTPSDPEFFQGCIKIMENDFSIRAYKIYILAKITIFREKIKSWFDHKENMVIVRMKRIDKPLLFAVKASQKISRL